MKNVIIAGILMLIGTIWGLVSIIFNLNNLATDWETKLGRFLSSAIQNGMIIPLVISILFIVFGLLILVKEYFDKEK